MKDNASANTKDNASANTMLMIKLHSSPGSELPHGGAERTHCRSLEVGSRIQYIRKGVHNL